jgi:prepilin-type N-terminal cleavage/methylation domain-containing protein
MRRASGFSLIEVMCAILILGIALVGLVQGLTTALNHSKESELQGSAALIAAGRIEFLRADGLILEGEEEGEGQEGMSLYRWKQTVTPAALDGLYEVSVQVQHAKTGQEIYELRTLVFDPPRSTNDSSGTGSRDRVAQRRREGRQR